MYIPVTAPTQYTAPLANGDVQRMTPALTPLECAMVSMTAVTVLTSLRADVSRIAILSLHVKKTTNKPLLIR